MRPGKAAASGWAEVLRALLRSLRAAPFKAAVSVALSLLMAVQLAASAVLLAILVNDIVAARWMAASYTGLGLGFLLGLGLVMTWTAYGFRAVVEEMTLVTVDELMVRGVSSRPDLRVFEEPELQDQLTMLRRDRVRLGNVLIVVLTLFSGCLQLLLTVVLLLRVNPVLGAVPALGVVPLLVSRRAERLRQNALTQASVPDRLAAEWARIGSSSLHAPELAVTGMLPIVQERHARADARSTRIRNRAERRAASAVLAGNCVFSLGYLAALAVAALGAIQGTGSVGNVVLVAVLASQVGGEVSLIAAMASALRTAESVAVRFRQLAAPSVTDAGNGTPAADGEHAPLPDGLATGISLRALTFRYPGASADALSGIDLDLHPGQTVALVGDNGAGKSTLVKLLCLLYLPAPGTVLADGRPLDQLDPDLWRSRLTAAFQEPARFNLTAREAIGIGDLTRADDLAAVRQALAAAGVSSLIDGLPSGLDTELGSLSPAAVQLSGGQWQQISLARAMMRPVPLIAFLDEPVSALDAGTETRLLAAYARAARRTSGRSTIGLIVTHRLAAARVADRIVVLRKGRVVEDGTHDGLMALGGVYATMFAAQAKGYE